MLARLTVATALAFAALPALAQENPRPMDLKEVDPAMVADMFGTWIITDERGKKRCEVVLKANATIGGQEIVVKPGCKKAFPVMDEIAAWRLGEGWAIMLVDATRKVREVFTTPDDRYIARDEVDGMFTIAPKE